MSPTALVRFLRRPAAFIGTLLGAVILYIDPLRETAFTDDWVYAVMTRRLLETGHYTLHDWAAANPFLHVYWGALWSSFLGFSYSALRISTLIVAAVGIVAFFRLCRLRELGEREAVLLTIAFVAAPLYLRHAFSFMTDVPFLSLIVVALVLYMRALDSESLSLMYFGSIAAAASILVRQFGVAFLPALTCVWWIGGERRRRLPLLAAGLSLPLFAAAAQIVAGTRDAPYTAHLRTIEALARLTNPLSLVDAAWRLAVIPVYLALFALPVVVLAIDSALRRRTREEPRGRDARGEGPRPREIAAVVIVTALLLAVGRWLDHPTVMPLLDWNLEPMSSWPMPVRWAVTGMLVAAGAWWGATVAAGFRARPMHLRSDGERLFDFFFLSLVAVQLVYVQFADRYLIEFLPLALLPVGQELWRERPIETRQYRSGLAGALLMLLVSAAWERGTLARGEALWRGGEWLRSRGVSPAQIHSESWEWEYTFGVFDRWLAGQPDRKNADFDDFFERFWPEAWQRARYLVATRTVADAEKGGRQVVSIDYRDGLFRRRAVRVVERSPIAVAIADAADCKGGFTREADATGWWQWTAERLRCVLPIRDRSSPNQVLEFEYWAPSGPFEVEIGVAGASIRTVLARGRGAFRSSTLTVLTDRVEVTIVKTDGRPAEPLSPTDPRRASFLVKNLSLRPALAPPDSARGPRPPLPPGAFARGPLPSQ